MKKIKISFFVVFFALIIMLICTDLMSSTILNEYFSSDAVNSEAVKAAQVPEEINNSEEKVGLVLSGGGAWGLAHIGVLEVIEEYNIQIDLISGTSAGAIVGALYADGHSPAQMKEMISELQWRDFLFPTLNSLGFFSISTVEESLEERLDAQNIEDLPLEFYITVTDIDSGLALNYSSGPLAKLLSAAAAVPVLFEPVEYDDRLLADGGLSENLPVEVLKEAGADIIIAVDVAGNFSFTGRPEGIIDYGNRAFNIMRRNMQEDPDSDILIQPDLDGFSGIEFDEYSVLILRGREAAEEYLAH